MVRCAVEQTVGHNGTVNAPRGFWREWHALVDSHEVHGKFCVLPHADNTSRRMHIVVKDRANESQAKGVGEEERKIYKLCVLDLQVTHRLTDSDVKVIVLYIGAQGTFRNYCVDFMWNLSLSEDLINRIVIFTFNAMRSTHLIFAIWE